MKKAAVIAAAVGAAAVAALYDQNSRVEVETFRLPVRGLPAELSGLRIVHLSDLHYPYCVLPPERLAALVAAQKPDLILLTGDLVYRFVDFDAASVGELARRLAAVAPCYASVGNHELWGGHLGLWRRLLERGGATVLDNAWTAVECRGVRLALCGLTQGAPLRRPADARAALRIALSHYPHWLRRQAAAGFDLVLAGHAHGGQVRVGGQGLFATGQGLLPAYTGGLYRMGRTRLVVSRGLSRIFPLVRVNNPPHLPVIVLQTM